MGSDLHSEVAGMRPDRLPWTSLTHPFLCSFNRDLLSTYSVPGPRQTGGWRTGSHGGQGCRCELWAPLWGEG